MLILNRTVGAAICIGDDIRVGVLSTSGIQVRLGITAPREVPVHREEIYERLKGRHGTVGTGAAPTEPLPARILDVLARTERILIGFKGAASHDNAAVLLHDVRELLQSGTADGPQ